MNNESLKLTINGVEAPPLDIMRPMVKDNRKDFEEFLELLGLEESLLSEEQRQEHLTEYLNYLDKEEETLLKDTETANQVISDVIFKAFMKSLYR